MIQVRTALAVLCFVVLASVSSLAQSKNIYYYTEAGFDPWGAMTKLGSGLKESPIGNRVMMSSQPALETFGATNPGDLICRITHTEYRCEGNPHYILTVVMYRADRDRSNSPINLLIGSTSTIINERSHAADMKTLRDLIVSYLNY